MAMLLRSFPARKKVRFPAFPAFPVVVFGRRVGVHPSGETAKLRREHSTPKDVVSALHHARVLKSHFDENPVYLRNVIAQASSVHRILAHRKGQQSWLGHRHADRRAMAESLRPGSAHRFGPFAKCAVAGEPIGWSFCPGSLDSAAKRALFCINAAIAKVGLRLATLIGQREFITVFQSVRCRFLRFTTKVEIWR